MLRKAGSFWLETVISATVLVSCSVVSHAQAQTRTWDGGAGTFSWHDANNWNPNGLPGPGDDVLIDVPGAITVTHSDGVTVINSLVCNENFNFIGGTIDIAATSSFNAEMLFANPTTTLTGTGDMFITDVCTWTGGIMSGTGIFKVVAGASLIIDGDDIIRVTRFIDSNGIVDYRNGILQMGQVIRVTDAPDARRAGQASLILNTPRTVSKVEVLSGVTGIETSHTPTGFTSKARAGGGQASLILRTPRTVSKAQVLNAVGGFQTAPTPTWFTSGARAGDGAPPIEILCPFENLGYIHVQNGSNLILTNLINTPGSIVIVDAGSQFSVTGDSTHEAGSSITGDGTLRLGERAGLSVVHQFLPGSSINMTTPVHINGGTVEFEEPQTFADLVLQNDGGSFPTIAGSADVTVTGSLQWVSGHMGGTGKTIIEPGAQLVMDDLGSGSGPMTFSRTIENMGEATWVRGSVTAQGGTGVFRNGSAANSFDGGSGILHLAPTTNATFAADSVPAGSALINEGLIERSSLTGTTQLTINVVNHGLIDIAPNCSLTMGGGSNETGGSIIAPPGSTLTFSTGSFVHKAGSSLAFDELLQLGNSNITTFESGCTLAAGGLIYMTAPSGGPSTTLNFNGDFSIPLLGMNFGGSSGICTLGGIGTVTITENLTTPGCTMQGSGKTVIAPGAVANLGGSTMNLHRTFENAGVCTKTGGAFQFLGGTLRNLPSGTLNLNNSGATNFTESGGGSFDNQGTLNKTGAGTVSMFTGLSFNVQPISNTGTINVLGGQLNMGGSGTNDLVQVSGTTLTGGTWNVGPGASLALTVASPLQTLGSGCHVALDGVGSTMSAISGLRTINSGASFQLLNGRDFAPNPSGGTFTNNGTLTLGADCGLAINGAYSQGTGAALNVAFDATREPAVTTTGNATLDGTLAVSVQPPPTTATPLTILSSSSGTVTGVFASTVLPRGQLTYGASNVRFNAFRTGDVNGDNFVNVTDLLAVITAWGNCPAPPLACPADIAPPPNGDGQVSVADLLMVISNWG